ncbi:hypothetical protein HXX76_010433 [Chlamydomonas incerta]|uniref:Uncharacterized protein n=1 Tax=Chlamydomonas incerta TaxID=51695 RepID=A0A835SRB7_CHLIN|nr:hypothetical protein HXX76_010433 [Chlamydomonas incerta]|eukprot:KAG2428283.1 hypothetical protein HXX76_010433 [Chlamydomonas incerta]
MPPQLPVAAVALAAVCVRLALRGAALWSPGAARAARAGPSLSWSQALGWAASLTPCRGAAPRPLPPPLLLPRTLGLPPELPVAAVALAAQCVRLAVRGAPL